MKLKNRRKKMGNQNGLGHAIQGLNVALKLEIDANGGINLQSSLPPIEVIKILGNVIAVVQMQYMEKLIEEKVNGGRLITPVEFDPKKLI